MSGNKNSQREYLLENSEFFSAEHWQEVVAFPIKPKMIQTNFTLSHCFYLPTA